MPAATRGYDGGKKINGRRRHVITDCLGLLLMVLVCAADVTDRQAARIMLPRLRARFHKITLVWADGGYAWSPGRRRNSSSRCRSSNAAMT
ncbi:transposase [Streptomyces mirabilis]|uniref:transposase n=1 Tax=Streptomyces mirabilis TaxID=68239 RepID=UPI003327AE4B